MSVVDMQVEMPPLPPPSLGFLGGPQDISLLRSFKDHVASHIYIGEVNISFH